MSIEIWHKTVTVLIETQCTEGILAAREKLSVEHPGWLVHRYDAWPGLVQFLLVQVKEVKEGMKP